MFTISVHPIPRSIEGGRRCTYVAWRTIVQSMAELTELNSAMIPNYLDEELKYVMANSKDIKLKFDDSKRILEILYGMVADMYIDVKQQTMGVHSNSQIPILMGILQNYDHKTLVDFFRRWYWFCGGDGETWDRMYDGKIGDTSM